MVHLDSASLDEYLLNLEHAKQKMSRRLLLRRMTGLMLVSSSLIPLTTACSAVTNAPPATTSSAPGTTILTYHGHSTGAVEAVRWSPDGKRIVSGSDDRTAQVWDAMTGGKVLVYRGHTDGVATVAWSPTASTSPRAVVMALPRCGMLPLGTVP